MAQRFRTDLKDEIVQGGYKLWRAVNSAGTILLNNFKMERTNGNTQEGDSFGAKEANAIHKFLNGLLDGTEIPKHATTITRDGHGFVPSWEGAKTGIVWGVDETQNMPVANSLQIDGQKLAAMSLNLNYINASTLYRNYSVGTQWIGAKILITTNIVQGTPFNAIKDYATSVNGNGVLEVYAYGSGFVSGHMLNVHVLLIR